MNDDRDVVEFVQSGRVRAPARDARVLAAMAAADHAAAGRPSLPRRAKLFAAAALVGGIAVVGAVAVLHRQGARSDTTSSGTPSTPDAPVQEREVPVWLGVTETLLRAPIVAVMDVELPPDGRIQDGCFAKVLRVVQGDLFVGQQVWLHARREKQWRPGLEDKELACVDLTPLSDSGSLDRFRGTNRTMPPWLLCLEPMSMEEKQAAGPTAHRVIADRGAALPFLQTPIAHGLQGMFTVRGPVPAATTPRGRLRAEFEACLRDADPMFRGSGLRAMGNWDGDQGGPFADDSPWRDPAMVQWLLSFASDPAVEVRHAFPISIPARVGEPGRGALTRLLFDAFCNVRTNAAYLLRKRFTLPSWADAVAGEHGDWVLLSIPGVREQFLSRAVDEAKRAGIDDRGEAFARMLSHASVQDRVVGALGLGASGHRELLPELQKCEGDDIDLVRAAVAWARIELGDARGYDTLRAQSLTASSASVHALDMLRSLQGKDALNALLAATKSPWPAARALAAAGLRDRRREAPVEVDRQLAELQQDPEELVRVAASQR